MQMFDLLVTESFIRCDFNFKSHIPGEGGKTRTGRVCIDKDGCLAMRGFDGMSPGDFFLLVGHIEGFDRQAKELFHPGALEKEAKMNATLGGSQPSSTIMLPNTEEFEQAQREAAESMEDE